MHHITSHHHHIHSLTFDGELSSALAVLGLAGIPARVALLYIPDDQLGVGPLLLHLILFSRFEGHSALPPVHRCPGLGQLTAEHRPVPLPRHHPLEVSLKRHRKGCERRDARWFIHTICVAI